MTNSLRFLSLSGFFLSLVLNTACGRSGGSQAGGSVGLQGSEGIKVQTQFNSNTGTLQLGANTMSTKDCVSAGWLNWPSFNSTSMELDLIRPYFAESVILNIIPNAQGEPVDYQFTATVADQGCGARELEAKCTLYNVTAYGERWQNDIPKDEFEVPDAYVYSPAQTCAVNNSGTSNNFAEFVKHVIEAARVNDRLRFEMYLTDGSGNYSRTIAVEFHKYEKLLGPVKLSAL